MSKERESYYNQAQEANKQASDIYKNEIKSAEDKFNALAEQNTGEAGYNKSLDLATKGAERTAAAAGNQAQNAYRKAGVNRAQAAQLAGNQAFNSMAGNLQNQQAQASGQLSNQMNAATTSAGLASNRASGLQSAGQNALNTYQNNQQGILNNVMGWTGLGGQLLNTGAQLAMPFISSDKEMKCGKTNLNECSKKIGDILDRHSKPKRDFKSLVMSDERCKINSVDFAPMKEVEKVEANTDALSGLSELNKTLGSMSGGIKAAYDKSKGKTPEGDKTMPTTETTPTTKTTVRTY